MLNAARETGCELPKMLTNAPTLNLIDQFYFQAYKRLHACSGMNGQIPWTAIVEYGREFDLEGDELEEFVTIIELVGSAHDKFNRETTTSAKNKLTAPTQKRFSADTVRKP
jgi:hypothetical protein